MRGFNKIFGIGLSKTGTSSLSEALNMLGIPSIHYPDDATTLNELRAGHFDLTILKKFTAISDTPVVPYYAQLDKQYPGSKFILTVRDMEPWLASVEKHWATAPAFEKEPLRKEFQDFIRTAVYGCLSFNKERFRYVYETHLHNVQRYFIERDDLLVLDICNGEGWKELCHFLQIAPIDAPFPHANQWMHKLIKATEDMRSIIPEGATCILIDDQALGKEFTLHRNFIPFPESAGHYAGPPSDTAVAIDSLKTQLRIHHPDYIVIGWPSFWYMDTYHGLSQFIESVSRCIRNDDELKIYQLDTPVPSL